MPPVSRSFLFLAAFVALLNIQPAPSLQPSWLHPLHRNTFQLKSNEPFSRARRPKTEVGRSIFLKILTVSPVTSIVAIANPAEAIEFVPPSPSYKGSYQDAIEILYSQRIAVDNISKVISDGNLEEAGFKVMQLSAQTGMAGKIILDSFQQTMDSADSIRLLKFLSCQKKFALLMELCDECGMSLQKALRGNFAAQIKLSLVVDETKSAYDDFLKDVESIEH